MSHIPQLAGHPVRILERGLEQAIAANAPEAMIYRLTIALEAARIEELAS